MEQKIFKDKYPIFEIEYKKDELKSKNIDEIITALKKRIEEHPDIAFIAIFDHYKHTLSLEDGIINPNIKDAKNIIFCFGKEIQTPEIMAIRPRSIGVCEMQDSFVINFLEAPSEAVNKTIEEFIKSLKTYIY
jgi:predicted RNase H-like nuclease